MKNFAGGGGELIPSEPGKFYLRALDPKTGKRVWEYPMTGPGTMWAGTVSTAGGVVFFADDDGQFVAVDGKTAVTSDITIWVNRPSLRRSLMK